MAVVLAIDDEPSVRAALASMLQSEGHTAVLAEGARTGIKAIERQNFDLALVDIFMPEMDGIEFMRCVQQMRPRAAHRRYGGFSVWR